MQGLDQMSTSLLCHSWEGQLILYWWALLWLWLIWIYCGYHVHHHIEDPDWTSERSIPYTLQDPTINFSSHRPKYEWTCIIAHTSIGLVEHERVSSHVALFQRVSWDLRSFAQEDLNPMTKTRDRKIVCDHWASIPIHQVLLRAMGGRFKPGNGTFPTEFGHILCLIFQVMDGFPWYIKWWSQGLNPPLQL